MMFLYRYKSLVVKAEQWFKHKSIDSVELCYNEQSDKEFWGIYIYGYPIPLEEGDWIVWGFIGGQPIIIPNLIFKEVYERVYG